MDNFGCTYRQIILTYDEIKYINGQIIITGYLSNSSPSKLKRAQSKRLRSNGFTNEFSQIFKDLLPINLWSSRKLEIDNITSF